MILPTKHIPVESTLLGVGGLLLHALAHPQTVSTLWERVRHNPQVGTFLRFTLALDLLYTMGLVALQEGLLTKRHST